MRDFRRHILMFPIFFWPNDQRLYVLWDVGDYCLSFRRSSGDSFLPSHVDIPITVFYNAENFPFVLLFIDNKLFHLVLFRFYLSLAAPRPIIINDDNRLRLVLLVLRPPSKSGGYHCHRCRLPVNVVRFLLLFIRITNILRR